MMEKTIQAGLMMTKKYFTLKELNVGEYETISLYKIMKFHVRRFEVEGLGNLCVMTVNMGIMKMSTFVITPYDKDMPLLSLDFIYMMNKRKAIIETYDLTKNGADALYQVSLMALQKVLGQYADLEDYGTDPAWYNDLMTVKAYKTGSKKQEERFFGLFKDIVENYARTASTLRNLSPGEKDQKRALISEYCDNMVEKGGVSTNQFKKSLGEEFTKRFFHEVFFGTEGME